MLIPPLLWTPEYAEAVIRRTDGASATPSKVDNLVRQALARQHVLDDKPETRLTVLLEESVLHRPIGGRAVLRQQLEHLTRAVERPHVKVRLVPPSDWHDGVFGTFTLGLMRRPYPSVALVEHLGGQVVLEAQAATAYQQAFDQIAAVALGTTSSMALIAAAAEAPAWSRGHTMTPYEFSLLLARPPHRWPVTNVLTPRLDLTGQPDQRAVTARREASSLAEAVVSVIEDLEAISLQPVRVCAGDWLTLADIAARIGRSREVVGLWSIGRQGPGGFPPPLNPGRDTRFFSWTEVSRWLRRRMGYEFPAAGVDLVVANLLLQARRLAPQTRDREVLGGLVASYAHGHRPES